MVQTIDKAATNLKALFDGQMQHQYVIAASDRKTRIAWLRQLKAAVLADQQEIRDALYADFKKPAFEVDLTEIYAITNEINHTIRHLRRWMRPEKVGTPLTMLGTSSYIHSEPKGVCLIISPWNYPFQLAIGPLISAIAAGNTAIIKPSEHTPHTAAYIGRLIEKLFEPRHITVAQGGVEVSTALLELPFHHIFFTGGPEIGKIVMAKAAKHLTSVTLELGGKSPTIVDETADIVAAAKRISMTKFLNNGQTCIAPDYVFVHASVKDQLVELLRVNIEASYGSAPISSPDYMRIVNEKHQARLAHYVKDAAEKGAKIVQGGQQKEGNYLDPTLAIDVPMDALMMQEEIFGPILPILSYTDISEVIQHIRQGEKPLALYIFSKKQQNIDHIIQSTSAGGVCVNNAALHFMNSELPFGGVNNSGIGKAHGKFGFDAFSNQKAVLYQSRFSATDMFAPPYTSIKDRLLQFVIRWF